MTAQETIIKYLKGRKLGATVPEIVKATGLNKNTVRRCLSDMAAYSVWTKIFSFSRKCSVTGKRLSAYGVQS